MCIFFIPQLPGPQTNPPSPATPILPTPLCSKCPELVQATLRVRDQERWPFIWSEELDHAQIPPDEVREEERVPFKYKAIASANILYLLTGRPWNDPDSSLFRDFKFSCAKVNFVKNCQTLTLVPKVYSNVYLTFYPSRRALFSLSLE